jgi:hypothetical protein
MIAAWVGIALLLQGVPVQPQQGGTITGILRDAGGIPFPGVRIAAMPQQGDAGTIPDAATMAALAETDAKGRYRLENVPPGRYHIAAGVWYLPTFYPGTQEIQRSAVIPVTQGADIALIDFRIEDTSIRGPDFGIPGVTSTLQVPVDIRVDGGGKVPVSGPAGFPRILMIAVGNTTPNVTVALGNASNITLLGPTADFKVTLENLPAGYSLKSLSFDNTDLRSNNLRLSAGTFAGFATTTVAQRSLSFTTAVVAAGNTVVSFRNNIPAVPAAIPPAPQATVPPTPVPPLSIVLEKTPSTSSPTGVRITGRALDPSLRQVYMSGIPGVFFSDGSFEFLGVPPGRHTIVAFDATERRPLAASVVVGDRDLEGVRLELVSLLPAGIRTPRAPGPAGTHTPGTAIPLATLHGTITDKETKQPIASGSAFISANGVALDMLDATGKFAFPGLLPGSYSLEIRLVDHAVEPRTIVIGDENVEVEIAAEKPKD